MNAAIVDTDVVSMLFKGDTLAQAYRPHITDRLLRSPRGFLVSRDSRGASFHTKTGGPAGPPH